MVANVIELPEDSTPTIVDHGFDDLSVPTVDAPVVDDLRVDDGAGSPDLGQHDVSDPLDGHLDHPHDPGFDIFT